MFIGHFGIGFAAKAAAPKVSLGSLFVAAQFLDLLWPTFLLLGLETVRVAPAPDRLVPLVFEHYPLSHSLLAAVLWALAVALVYWRLRRSRRGALVMAALVVSHWLLDAVVHRPDLPLLPGGGPLIGLGFWDSLPKTLIVEMSLFAAGIGLYARRTRPRDATGAWALWSLVSFLLVIHAGNLFGAPPPGSDAIAWAGQAQWLLVLWAYWVDRHRRPV